MFAFNLATKLGEVHIISYMTYSLDKLPLQELELKIGKGLNRWGEGVMVEFYGTKILSFTHN